MGHTSYGLVASVDGYIASAGHDLPVQLPIPEEALHRYFNRLQERTALSLYGRNMYEIMKYWDAPPEGSADYELEFGEAWRKTPKVVISTTLDSVGPNARLVKTDIEATLRRIKAETDGEIEVAGATLAASLARWGLLDEIRFYVVPVVLGGGKPFFEAGLQLELEPAGVEQLPQHCTLLRFRPKRTA